jgi:hypothetical protein
MKAQVAFNVVCYLLTAIGFPPGGSGILILFLQIKNPIADFTRPASRRYAMVAPGLARALNITQLRGRADKFFLHLNRK